MWMLEQFFIFLNRSWQVRIFTARRICIARTMPWQDVCPFVSHTPVLFLHGYTYLKVFLPSGSPTILVFPCQTGWQYCGGNIAPPNGGVECKGYEKNHDFQPISRHITQIMQDRAIVTIEGTAKLSNGTGLNDPELPLTQISR